MLRSLHGKGKTLLMLLCWVTIISRLFVSSLNRPIGSMASSKGEIGRQTVRSESSKNLLLTYLIYHCLLLVIPDYAKFMLVVFHQIHNEEILNWMHTDAMYAGLHVQKCKKPLNELFHALSKSISILRTCLVIHHTLTLALVHRAAALATGCQASIEYGWGPTFDLRQNKALGMLGAP